MYRMQLRERRVSKATGVTIYDVTSDLYCAKVESTSRQAPTDGTFEPGVYKVTAMRADTRRVYPSSGGRTSEWKVEFTSYITYFTLTGDLDMLGIVEFYVNKNFVPAYSPLTLPYKNEALLRAFGNVGNLAQLELGQELGELKETYELLLQTILTLLKPRELWSNFRSVLAMERKYQQLTPKILRLMPQKYMEFRYGWMPIMRSIHDICQALKEGLKKVSDSNTIYTAHGRAKGDILIKSGPTAVANGLLRSDVSYLVNNIVTGRAAVHYKVKTPPNLGDLLGLTPKFIPETIWALSTCSFVWDWFLTIGPWIQALRGTHDWSYQILGNTVSATVQTEGSSKVWTRPASAAKQSRTFSSAVIAGKSYQRLTNQSIPYPEIRASSVFDVWKIFDLLILASKYLPKQLRRDVIDAFSLRRINTQKYTE